MTLLQVPTASQLDPRVAAKFLGDSGRTVGGFGCLDICIYMALKVMGYASLDIVAYIDGLNANKSYTKSGDLYHSAIPKLYPHVFWWREDDTINSESSVRIQEPGLLQPSEAIYRVKRMIDRGIPVPVMITFPSGLTHWTLPVGYTDTDLIVNDPAHGDQIHFSTRYGDPLKTVDTILLLIGQPLQGTTPDLQIEGTILQQLIEGIQYIPPENKGYNLIRNAIQVLIG